MTIAVGLVACVAPDTDESEVAQSRQAVDACRSVLLDASVSYAPRRHDDAVIDLSPAFRFAVPSEIPIVQGNGARQHSVLTSQYAGIETKCRYRSLGVAHPTTPEQLAQASRYVFEHCTTSDDSPNAPPAPTAGDVITTTHLELTIDGDNKGGTTRAQLSLAEAQPCGGAGGGGGGGAGGAGGQASGGANTGASTSVTTSASTTSSTSVTTSATTGATTGAGAGGESVTTSSVTSGVTTSVTTSASVTTGAGAAGGSGGFAGTGGGGGTGGAGTGGGTGGTGGTGGGDPCAVAIVDDGDPCTIDVCELGVIHRYACTPLDPTAITTAADAWAFLYSGSDPIQTGVAPGTIEFLRAGMVQGNVALPSGEGAMGASVTILSHPEFGETRTDIHGRFMLAVNAGEALTVDVRLPGYLPVQRKVRTEWQEVSGATAIVLTARDPNVTFVDLAGLTSVVEVEGSLTDDERGARQGTLLVTPGTTAALAFADGTTTPISQLDLRITEFTVGTAGPSRMPAELPRASAYTYAIDVNADEAVAAGAEHVLLSKPALYFVDNFLGVPVGTVVPVGSYEASRGVWASEPNGVVMAILDGISGVAAIDLDGDGAADADDVLELAGLDIPVRERLAALYPSGTELWFAAFSHLSYPDLNFSEGPPDDYADPDVDLDIPDEDPCSKEEAGHSTLECTNQVLGERIPLVGTPYSLSYRSRNVPGRLIPTRRLRFPLTRTAPPDSVVSIDGEVHVAGRTFSHHEVCPCAADLGWTADWDEKDAMGRDLVGSAKAEYVVAYNYRASQYTTVEGKQRAFDLYGSKPFATTVDGTRVVTARRTFKFTLGSWRATSLGLGGFTIDLVHELDVNASRLQLGDGTVRGVQLFDQQVARETRPNYSSIDDLDFTPDGSKILIVSVPWGSGRAIVKVARDGTESTILGAPDCVFGLLEGVATTACPNGLSELAAAPDGSVYFVTSPTQGAIGRVLERITPDGMLHHVAGNPSVLPGDPLPPSDGVPATSAVLMQIGNVVAQRTGAVFFSDAFLLHRIDPGGDLETIGQYVSTLPVGADGPLDQVSLGNMRYLAIDSSDALLISSSDFSTAYSVVSKLGADGILRRVAGGGTVQTPDGVPAKDMQITAWGQALPDERGGFFLTDFRLPTPGSSTPLAIVHVDGAGMASVIAGRSPSSLFSVCDEPSCGIPGPARDATFGGFGRVARSPDGTLHALSGSLAYRFERYVPGLQDGPVRQIPDVSGRRVHVFDRVGRHLETRDSVWGTVELRVGRDQAGRITTLTDENDLVTTIERSANGDAHAVVGPFGHRTTLTIDETGYLERAVDPSGASFEMTYESGGLLATFTNRNGHTSSFSYDPDGRLVRDEGPTGTAVTLTRDAQSGGLDVTYETALGRATKRSYSVDSVGTTHSETVSTAGLVTAASRTQREQSSTAMPDGTLVATERNADPRYLMLAPLTTSKVTLPSGLSRTTSMSRSVVLSNPNDLSSLTSLTETSTVGGRSWTRSYQVATKTTTATSPAGRIVRSTHDALGHIVSIRPPDVLPISLGYDAQGRVITTTQGARTATVTYGTDGFVETATNPIDQTVTLGRDANGRVVQVQRPDLAVSTYGYSPAGQTTRVTPPGKPDHILAFNELELPSSYTPPAAPGASDATTFGYDLDQAITSVAQPGARHVDVAYDAAGRVDSVTFPTGVITTDYDAVTGHVTSVTGPTGVDLSFAYDGARLTGTTFSGGVNHSLAWGHDTSFRLTSETIDGAHAVAYAYDNDDLVTQAGPLHLARAPASGRVTGTTAGNLGDTLSYNAYGEIQSYSASASGSPLIAYSYVRDDIGRIAEKTETRGGVSHVYAYEYDDAGRLTTVTEDGVVVESYDFDDNGNRVAAFNSDGAFTATYDNQDRIGTSSRWIFEHEPSGEVKRKTDVDTLDTTLYEHDALGNLRSVTLPDGRHVDYLVDAQGRRVQKRLDGVAQKGWIWRSGLQPVAELDGAGNVVARYVYAGGGNAPALIQKGAATYRLLKDHLGSVRLAVDVATGAVVQELEYDSWGRVLLDTNPGWQPFGYAGGLYDADTGLVRFGAREYDADTGRWLTKDKSGFRGGKNFYEYAVGDPIGHIDVSGKDPVTLEYWLRWLLDEDRNRNLQNQCPPRVPSECPSGREWTRTSPLSSAWRADDGSECIYDSDGDLQLGGESFNYGPDPFSLAHIVFDFWPGFSAELAGGKAADSSQTSVCGCESP